MLTSKQRAGLKSLANDLVPLFQVGKGGVGPTLIKQTDDALSARELIKLSVLETAPESAQKTAEQLAEETKSEIVQVIGRKIIFYRKNPDNIKIILKK